MKTYDLIIIGAGPAGITAGIYAKNFGLDCLIIGDKVGGLVNAAYKIENYPGIFNISGKELFKKFLAHQRYLKVPFKKEKVKAIKKTGKIFKISAERNQYQGRAVILAFGTETRKLNIKNIEKFEGRGVSYRLGDNAFLIKNTIIAVMGGANAAVMSAVSLAEEAKKVYLIYRREKLRADAIWVSRLKRLKNVEVIYKANVVELKGKNRLGKIVLDKKPRTRGSVGGRELKINALFVEAGCIPNTFLIHDLKIKTDKNGYIKVDKTQATNIPGIFAAGDATTGSNEFRQIITACSEAAIAVLGVFNFLSGKK